MSKTSAEIQEAIQRLAGTFGVEILQVVDTIATSDVDEDTLTFDTEAVKGVLLSPVPNDGMMLYPANKSTVKIGFSTKTTAFLLQASDLEKARITIGNCEYFIDKDGIKLHGDNFDGIAKVKELTEKYNNLENQVNSILAILKATVIPLAPSGTYPFASLYAAVNNLTPTQQSEIENTKVKHGNS